MNDKKEEEVKRFPKWYKFEFTIKAAAFDKTNKLDKGGPFLRSSISNWNCGKGSRLCLSSSSMHGEFFVFAND
jgi:hypothetical protein